MTEWILSSSILILVVISLRTVLKGKISLRLQYTLWALVLLRLLIPVSFCSSRISVANLTAQREISITVEAPLEKPVDLPVQNQPHIPNPAPQQGSQTPEAGPVESKPVSRQLTWKEAALFLWSAGFAAVTGVFFLSNLRFRRRILQSRYELDLRKGDLPVYATAEIDTPCLFGLGRPAIYVTYPVADDETLLRHTLEHEATHYRHGDHIWSVLRCLCLAIHWYNPLVWWAAFLSRQDGELACDEATIRRLGEGERAEYGRTLIGMTCQKKANVLITATTMNSGKSSLKERILLIAKKPKMAVYTLIAVVLIAAVAVGCTFTGARKEPSPGDMLPEFFEAYNYELVGDRMERQDIHYLASVEDYALVYCSGMGPTLTLYRYEIDGDRITVTDQAGGDYAISGGLSVNHLIDGDKHIYFGTISDYHWIPEDDSRMPLDWKLLIFWDAQGNQEIVNVGSEGYLCVMDEPMTDFWVAVNGGDVPLKMEQYLSQGYSIHESDWFIDPQRNPPATTPSEECTISTPTEIPDNAPPINIPEMLHEEADPEKICIGVQPTALSKSCYDLYYIIPENQELLLEYFEAAAARATELQWDSDIEQSGWVIEYQGQCWWAMEDGSFRGDRTIGTDEAKALYDICREAIKEAGFGNPVRPQDITGITSATLYWDGGTTVMDPNLLKRAITVTQPYILKRIEALFSNSQYYGSVQCPFGALLELTLENGETLLLAMSTDSCASWMSEGVAYGYGEMTNVGIEGNEEFYSFFMTDIIHEKAQDGPEAMEEYWPYIHWGEYSTKYGHAEAFKLLYMFEDYLLANPTDWNIYVALTTGRGLDGAYAEFYAYLIGELFEAAPATFNFACRQMVPEKYVEEAVNHLAYYWGITPEEARARLEQAHN